MRVTCDITCNLEPIMRRLSLDPAQMHRVATAGLRGMTKYVPMDTGRLMGSGHVEGSEAVWSTDYAVYAYYPRGTIHRTKNPTATREWADHYMAQGAPEVVEEVARIVSG